MQHMVRPFACPYAVADFALESSPREVSARRRRLLAAAALAGAWRGGGGDEGVVDVEQDSTLPGRERWVALDSRRHRGDVLIGVGVGAETCLLVQRLGAGLQ